MERCIARGISSLHALNPSHPSSSRTQFQPHLRCKTHFPFHSQFTSGLQCHRNSFFTSSASEEISTDSSDTTPYKKDEHKPDSIISTEDSHLNEAPQQDSVLDYPLQVLKFLEDLNVKIDYEEAYSALVFGGGGAVTLWLVAAVIGAIDSIPVFPKVMELVGLGYTLWFSSRYLLFKKNRDELIAKIEQIQQQVLGSDDN